MDGKREGQLSLGESINVRAWVRSNILQPEDFTVELVFGEARDENIDVLGALPMKYIKKEPDDSYSYQISLQPQTSGSIVYGVRVLPNHQHLVGKHTMGLIRWS